MGELQFKKLMSFFRNRKSLMNSVVFANGIITIIIFISYPALVLSMLYMNSNIIINALLVPLVSFIILSVFRNFYNSPRPYEKYEFTPIAKVSGKKGKSFPSRHVFSAFIIAFTFLNVSYSLGVIYIVLAIFLAILRVFCGVHFIKDVIAGALFALLCALVGYLII